MVSSGVEAPPERGAWTMGSRRPSSNVGGRLVGNGRKPQSAGRGYGDDRKLGPAVNQRRDWLHRCHVHAIVPSSMYSRWRALFVTERAVENLLMFELTYEASRSWPVRRLP
jgi:hypothetical protein